MKKIFLLTLIILCLFICSVNAAETKAVEQPKPTIESLTIEQDRDLARWQLMQYQLRDLQSVIQLRDTEIKKLQEANKPKEEPKKK
jgi:hypothetical protein